MKSFSTFIFLILSCFFLTLPTKTSLAFKKSFMPSTIQPETVSIANQKKNNTYIKEGMITGGDQAIDDIIIAEIRWADNSKHERIVFDLKSYKNDPSTPLFRAPYYQISAMPAKKQVIISIWGHPQLDFDIKKFKNSLKKSTLIQNVQFLPKIEEDLWIFALELKAPTPIEVFELTDPMRITLDLQRKNYPL